jgi:hypothetical protein
LKSFAEIERRVLPLEGYLKQKLAVWIAEKIRGDQVLHKFPNIGSINAQESDELTA